MSAQNPHDPHTRTAHQLPDAPRRSPAHWRAVWIAADRAEPFTAPPVIHPRPARLRGRRPTLTTRIRAMLAQLTGARP